MKGFALAAAATTLVASANAAIDPIVIKGSKFFYKTNGTQFFMKGVAYQQGVSTNTTQTELMDYVDPLADAKTCKRDIKHLKKLYTNTIRVYAIDPEEDHKECMDALADAGIYVIADLSQPGESINRDDPEWNTDLYKRYTSVVDELAQYDNTLGFFAGNEVSNQPNNTMASAFVKAAVRDTKAYIKSKNYRALGVGYATNDDKEIREDMAAYFNCGNSTDSIDFWGYNIYSWCGDSSFKDSGFDVRTEEFASYNVPVFFAEYGCNTPRMEDPPQARPFTEVAALYGDKMTDVWSGGIVYMYFEEDNEYGLVNITDGEVTEGDDFKNLQKQLAKIDPTGVKMDEYEPTNTAASKCPATDDDWTAEASPLPPAANAQACTCMVDTLTCVVNTDELDEEDFGDLFGTVCGYADGKYCDGINRNYTRGPYGAYSMCTSEEQLSFALTQYHKAYTDGCDFRGKAKTQDPSPDTATECEALIEAAGPEGTGTITEGANAGEASSSKGAAPGLIVPSTGFFGLGMYVGAAVLSGMAIVLL